ncbi:MAG: FecR domain-containing protein, partial [Bacteroidetes bacterium]|nr:FecR domain-containing protein [Bacteroidota bacterium]
MEDSVDIIIRMAELTKRSLREQISPEELVELKDWLAQSENHRRYLANLFSDESLQEYAWSSRSDTTVQEKGNTETDKIRKGPVIFRRLIAWAALMAILGGVTYFLWWQSKGQRWFEKSGPMSTASTIEPGTNKAVLTLPNGQRLSLNNSQDTDLSLSNSVIQQRGCTIKYQSAPDPSRPECHILSTPRGGQWHVELPDGSEVWLNAASSIKYPTSFLKNDREVEITGEAFFQVKSSPSAPFIVKAPLTTITVLGTSFNVDAYSSDSTVETTLVNGAVKVSAAGKTRNLQP